MPGFEIFGDDEKNELDSIVESGVLFRYGFGRAGWNSSKAKNFELELSKKIGVKYAHLCSSGSASLLAAIIASGIGFGDEVIVPPFTFVATIESILLAGAVPVFSEIDETLCLCPKNIGSVLTNKSKAVIPVHMCGAMARIDEIKVFCDSKGLILIEDACQAVGSTFGGKMLGTFGKAGCFSFDYAKTITCGEGGAVITDDEKIYSFVDAFSDHGHDHIGNDRGGESHLSIGFNFRISELNAAFGLAQLRKLDYILEIQRRNKEIIKKRIEKISRITFRELPDKKGDSATFLSIFMPSYDKARIAMLLLSKVGIDFCFHWFDNNWHYFKNWDHIKTSRFHFKLFKEAGVPDYSNLNLSKSDDIMRRVISIQIKIGWTIDEVEFYGDKIATILNDVV